MAIDRNTWLPSAAPQRLVVDRVPGALGGSLLLQQPAFTGLKAQIEAFVAPGPPLAVEIGFDHAINLLANARLFPKWRWLGCELRRNRVLAAQDNAPANCLPLRLDGRTVLACLLAQGRVDRVDILFPTPSTKPRHMLFSRALEQDLARCLAPTGVVHIATDVPGIAALCDELFAGWSEAPLPPRAPDLSRRERVCRRDGVRVWDRAWSVRSR